MAIDILPYEQGYLDGLCGIYSIINATRLIVNDMREEEAMKLFSKCMRHVEKRKSLGKVSTEGVNEKDIWSILKKVVIVDYGVKVERPFYNAGELSVYDYFLELSEYFGKDGKRSAMICVEREDWDHWTVIRSLTMKHLKLFDSSMMKTINTSRCVTDKPTKKKPYLVNPKVTFFIYEK
jgi:hypothetical protein